MLVGSRLFFFFAHNKCHTTSKLLGRRVFPCVCLMSDALGEVKVRQQNTHEKKKEEKEEEMGHHTTLVKRRETNKISI